MDLGRYHPDPEETYANFVKLTEEGGEVDEPTNVPGNLGLIYVGDDACLGDANADRVCNILDKVLVRNEFGRSNCHEACQRCGGDVNGDGVVNVLDKVAVRNDFGRNCTLTPPE